MNILFITQLYPLTESSKNSFALHYFAKVWVKSNKVVVLRPYLSYEKEPLPDKTVIYLDGIKINIINPRWIPVLKRSLFNPEKAFNNLNFKPDVIVSHLYNSYLNFYDIAKKYCIPFVVGIHNSDLKLLRNKLQKRRALKVIQNADGVVFRSEALKNQFIEKFGVLNTPVFVANSGLPSNYISYAKKLIGNNDLLQKSKYLKFVSACSLIKLKHIDEVLEALSKIQSEGYSSWDYTIIGDGPEEERLKKLSKKLKINHKVHFAGRLPRKQVFEQLKQHHIFVMPSYPETFGLAYLEAMAAGCIVIGTKGWGIDGIVNDRKNGFLHQPGNPQSITNIIRELISTPPDEFRKIQEKSIQTSIPFEEETKANEYLKFLRGEVLKV